MSTLLSERFAGLLKKSFTGAVETSLQELIGSLEAGENVGILEKVSIVSEQLKMFGLCLEPPVTIGDFETVRVMRQVQSIRVSSEEVVREVSAGEAYNREFKSSLYYDRRRALHDKTAGGIALKSDAVCFSALKTICAFLNGDGGTLFLGVSDEGKFPGIDDDLQFVTDKNLDSLQLHLRDLIRDRFTDGNTINNLVSCEFVEVEDSQVARIRVSPRRSKLTCVKVGSGQPYQVFVRQGNRTAELKIDEVEEYLRSRNAM